LLLINLAGTILIDDIMKVKDRYLEDLDWAGEHHTELLKKYRNEWVAIYNKQVVAHGHSGKEVKSRARAQAGDQPVAMYYVDSGSNIYAG
jgi:hypothetical protein